MSILSVNNNLLAANTANNLNAHYARLATSTQRLSSGLRINSAADDAAGLAIRELMRSDITTLHQGMRNVNDAISMIQTFDGALAIIDEKLIRMKELAEQASTGTYNSTQRMMIDSEFQAMGSEINRIARATDFNGVKLIDGTWIEEREIKPGTITKASESGIYEIQVSSSIKTFAGQTVQALRTDEAVADGINHPEALAEGITSIITINSNAIPIGNGQYLRCGEDHDPGSMSAKYTVKYDNGWIIYNGRSADKGGPQRVTPWKDNGKYGFVLGNTSQMTVDVTDADGNPVPIDHNMTDFVPFEAKASRVPKFTPTVGTIKTQTYDKDTKILSLALDLGNDNIIEQQYQLDKISGQFQDIMEITFDVSIKQERIKVHFGTANDSAEDYYYIDRHDVSLKTLGLDGMTIQTQESAQNALESIDEAIVKKDKVRAKFGALQNRLENTMSNISIQAENLQASESRISDADIAQEMTNFVRNQILSQSAVAMLSQANSLPQMVMQLIR